MARSIPVLSEGDVANVLTYAQLIPLMRETLIAFSSGSVLQPVRQMLVVEDQERYLGIMPAVIPDAMGAKLVHTPCIDCKLANHPVDENLGIVSGGLQTKGSKGFEQTMSRMPR